MAGTPSANAVTIEPFEVEVPRTGIERINTPFDGDEDNSIMELINVFSIHV